MDFANSGGHIRQIISENRMPKVGLVTNRRNFPVLKCADYFKTSVLKT